MSKKKAIEVIPPLTRAQECTQYLESFEASYCKWLDLALILVEMESEELLQSIGCETWDEWAEKHAPKSYRLCYIVKRRYKSLKAAGFSHDELRLMPKETAEWASKSKNISPAALKKPEVKEALKLPKQKAVRMLREVVPDEHVEETIEIPAEYSETQAKSVLEGYEAFKILKDEKASFADFIEFLKEEWFQSVFAEREGKSVTVQQCWEQTGQQK